ncbi:MAG: 16S rRNA (adenine(1518)-N(6)/adenine(1519)-N(6))-dimethyltransferase RsmA [Candidatus Glassbacteria bacterium]
MPRKRTRTFLSQIFLVDESIARKLVDSFRIDPHDVILEIGPGRGFLTAYLLKRSSALILVERDRRLVRLLKSRFREIERITVISGDFLKLDISELMSEKGRRPLRIIGMIPYHITTPILMHILNHRKSVTDALLVMQKEVALRVVASPGSRAFGSLSIAVQYWADPVLLFPVGRDCFRPKPKVESQAIHLHMRDEPPVKPKNPELFFYLVRSLFSKRRKQIQKSLRGERCFSLGVEDIDHIESACGLDLSKRPEELSIKDFSRLSDALSGYRKTGSFSTNFFIKAPDPGRDL